MFGNVYEGKKVLVTGHCGVKGSWLALWLHRLNAKVYGISHSPRTNPNHYKLLNLRSMMEMDAHTDISTLEEINNISPDIVFHLAARAIVAQTFTEPEETFKYTVMGAVHILELCRRCPSVKGVVVVETDKVYENKEWLWGYRENDELGGVDPYSASKVCVDTVVRCYRESFGMNIAAARAGNILCGGDWSFGRLIPDIVRATAKGKKVIIHTPNATRPFQHVLEALQGYLLLGRHILEGKDVNAAWNFGPTGEMTVLEVLQAAKDVWPAIDWEVDNEPTHPFMTYLLKIDSTKSYKELGWQPVWNMREAVERAVKWYFDYYQNGNILTEQDIIDYENNA